MCIGRTLRLLVHSGRSHFSAANVVEGTAASLPLLEAADAAYASLVQAAPTHDTFLAAGQVAAQIGEYWADRGRTDAAVPALQRAVAFFERAWALALALPDDAADAASEQDTEQSRLGQLVSIAVAAAEALCVLARAAGDPTACERAVALLAEVHRLDTAFRHPAHHVQWAAVLTAWSDLLWSALPPAVRNGSSPALSQQRGVSAPDIILHLPLASANQ